MSKKNDAEELDLEEEEDLTEDEDVEEEEEEDLSDEGDDDDDSEMDLPAAKEALKKAQARIRVVNRESAGRRHKLADLQKRFDAHTKTGDEATQELTAVQNQLEAATKQLAVAELRDKFDGIVVTAKIPFVSATAQRDAFKFARPQLEELTDDAVDDDVLDIVKDIIKKRPYLRTKKSKKNINSTNKGKTDAVEGIDMEEIVNTFGIKTR